MDIQSFIQAKSELTHNLGQCGPIVLSTRLRLARNLRDFPFPSRASQEQRQNILETCESAIQSIPSLQKEKCTSFHMQKLEDLQRQVLVERHLISPEMATGGLGSGVIINKTQSIAIMINEEDHLRIQILKSGFQFKKAWKIVNAIDTQVEDKLTYAFSSKLGYLTACPTNLGTAMRASIMMHLPGLVIAEHMEKVIRAVNQLGLTVRGLFGEGSEANGSVFQISNQHTLGESEEAVIDRLSAILNNIIEQEQNARQKLLSEKAILLLDRISRAFGVLRNSYCLGSVEAMNMLSLMRLAIDLGFLEEDFRNTIDRLFIEIQPGHIQAAMGPETKQNKRDEIRAKVLREEFEKIEKLTFKRLP